MYTILTRNGWKFASQGCLYVVIDPQGVVVYSDMHKLRAEAEFKKCCQ